MEEKRKTYSDEDKLKWYAQKVKEFELKVQAERDEKNMKKEISEILARLDALEKALISVSER